MDNQLFLGARWGRDGVRHGGGYGWVAFWKFSSYQQIGDLIMNGRGPLASPSGPDPTGVNGVSLSTTLPLSRPHSPPPPHHVVPPAVRPSSAVSPHHAPYVTHA